MDTNTEIQTTPNVLIDLDGTLATYTGHHEPGQIGAPIWPMVQFIHYQRQLGNEVRIFTARAGNPVDEAAIRVWLRDVAGFNASIDPTNPDSPRDAFPDEVVICKCKDYNTILIVDDRAKQAIENTGQIVGLTSQLQNSTSPSGGNWRRFDGAHKKPFRGGMH